MSGTSLVRVAVAVFAVETGVLRTGVVPRGFGGCAFATAEQTIEEIKKVKMK